MFKKSKKKIEYITLEEMKRELKSGIIVLENRYFNIEKISLELGLDEKERELEIEEILEDRSFREKWGIWRDSNNSFKERYYWRDSSRGKGKEDKNIWNSSSIFS